MNKMKISRSIIITHGRCLIRPCTYYCVIFLLLLSCPGCEKERLTGDLDVLVGTWKWVYTNRIYNGYSLDFTPVNYTLTPGTEGKDFSIRFYKRGVVKLYKDDDIYEKWAITTDILMDENSLFLNDSKRFDIQLTGDTLLSGYVNQDTLMTMYYFPYNSGVQDNEEGAHTYFYNYFIREK